MVHTDAVAEKTEFNYEGIINFSEFLSLIKDSIKRYNYFLIEKSYTTKNKDGLRTTNIKWGLEKELDDYNKAVVDFRINLNDYKEKNIDGEKVIDGKLQITALGLMSRDYGEKWKMSPTKRFLRAVYDKYIMNSKNKKADEALKEMVNNLMKEIKDYTQS